MFALRGQPIKYGTMLHVTLIAGAMLCAAVPEVAFGQNAAASITLDPTFHTPAPPNPASFYNADHVFWGTMGMLVAGICASAIAIFDACRLKTTVPLGIVLGAALCVFPECVDNYLAGCIWSISQEPSHFLYFLMGRTFEYYVVVMWWAFGVILGYIFYTGLQRNLTTGGLWTAFALSGLADIVIEELLLRYGGIYTYFGHHPLVILGYFPWWWLFVNVSAIYLSMAIAYRLRHALNGWKSIFVALLMPLCYIGGFSFAALPTIYVIQGNFSPLVTQTAGVLSCILALLQTGGILYFILGRHPLAFGEREGMRAAPRQPTSSAYGAPAFQR